MQLTDSELWRVQLATGEIRTMTLDDLDRAFDEGLIDARTPVLAPSAASWTTLGEAAGLDEVPVQPEQAPSLSPVAISAPSAHAAEETPRPEVEANEAPGELDLDELALRSRRPAALGLAAAVAALAAVGAVVLIVGQLGRGEVEPEVDFATGAEAPPAAMPLPPPAAPEPIAPPEQPSLPTADSNATSAAAAERRPSAEPEQKQLKAEKPRADKASGAKAKKSRVRKTKRAPSKRTPAKRNGPFIEGGDPFDPLNGAL